MNTATENLTYYRPVKIEFLDLGGGENIEIFYKTQVFGTTKFVKFASTDPRHQDKVRQLLETGENMEEFYVHVEDLTKYYQHVTRSLRTFVSNPNKTIREKTQKIYDVSKGIMREFFDYNASPKILRSSEEVMGIMEDCMNGAEAGYYGITQITNKDYYTYTHSVNVGLYCMTFGLKTKMSRNDIRELGLGGMLHDVGKSKIGLEILNKTGKLTKEEFDHIKKHSAHGVEILNTMQCYGKNVIHMAGEHHENYTGGGYPDGLVEDEISRYARICKIMDVYDALTTCRSYKKAIKPFDALTLMRKEMVSQFDPELFQTFITLMGPTE